MESKVTVLLVLIALASSASAWTDYADTYFCESAVAGVWGPTVKAECLDSMTADDQATICALLLGKRDECMDIGEVVNPAVIPNRVGEEDLHQAGDCPVTKNPETGYICAKETQATDKASYWFNQAKSADSICKRVQFFCVGANYLAQGYNQFNTVLYEDDKCKEIVYRKADQALRGNQSKWGANELCVFNYNLSLGGGVLPREYAARIGLNDLDVTAILKNLTGEAKGLKAQTYPKGQPTTTTQPSSKNQTSNASKDSCLTDDDCVLVQADCCGCTAGGGNTVYSREYAPVWNALLGERCKETYCMEMISNDPTCSSAPVCVNKTCGLRYVEPAKTTTTRTTTTRTTATVRTTTIPTTTLEPTTTTVVEERHGGSNAFLYIVGLLVVLGGAYMMYTLLQGEDRKLMRDEDRKRGLRGLSGRGETSIELGGPSTLADADRTPRKKELIPLKEREAREREQRRARPPEPPKEEPKEDTPSDKRRLRSNLRDTEKDDTTLGRR